MKTRVILKYYLNDCRITWEMERIEPETAGVRKTDVKTTRMAREEEYIYSYNRGVHRKALNTPNH